MKPSFGVRIGCSPKNETTFPRYRGDRERRWLAKWPRSGGLIRLVKARATEAAGLAQDMPCRPCKRPILRRARPGGASKLVRGAEAVPVPAIDADRYVDLAHHDGFAVAHVAGVALDQVGAQVAAGGEARGIAEDAAVAAVGAVPHHIAGALRMRVDFVVHRQIAVAVDHRAEHHARVLGEESLLKRRQPAIGPAKELAVGA